MFFICRSDHPSGENSLQVNPPPSPSSIHDQPSTNSTVECQGASSAECHCHMHIALHMQSALISMQNSLQSGVNSPDLPFLVVRNDEPRSHNFYVRMVRKGRTSLHMVESKRNVLPTTSFSNHAFQTAQLLQLLHAGVTESVDTMDQRPRP